MSDCWIIKHIGSVLVFIVCCFSFAVSRLLADEYACENGIIQHFVYVHLM